jgi:hypothetical protein
MRADVHNFFIYRYFRSLLTGEMEKMLVVERKIVT